MRLSVCKRMSFAAAHCLPGYDGQCANLHGHDWVLDIEVSRDMSGVSKATNKYPQDMVVDFVELKKVIKELIIDKLDHHYLNDIFEVRPTAEMMVGNFVDILNWHCLRDWNNEIRLESIRLYESPTSFCEWKRSNQ